MAKIKKSMIVKQTPADSCNNKYVYYVTETVNTLDTAVGDFLTADEVEKFILAGVKVTVRSLAKELLK
jgi:hypothetical protein